MDMGIDVAVDGGRGGAGQGAHRGGRGGGKKKIATGGTGGHPGVLGHPGYRREVT